MKCIRKTAIIIKDNFGETMVEVLVAFTLLSIMLVLFAQGITFATRSEVNASKSRLGADQAMTQVHDSIASRTASSPYDRQVKGYFNDRIKQVTYTYTVDGQTYTYVYYEPIVISNG